MKREQARTIVRSAGGAELAERLDHLDALPVRPTRPAERVRPREGATPDFDVVLAGGGLSLLYAPLLAAEGHKVAVVERARAGGAHREWNASRRELEVLSRTGLASAREIDEELVVARYRHGVCRWFGGHEHVVRGVLDCAVDAGALLAKARSLAESRGVTFLDGTSVVDHAGASDTVTLVVETGGVKREIVARAMVDARGASSPFATADIVCPTVGGVLSGLTEGEGPTRVQPDVGEILATTEGVEDQRQHLWEAFPGRGGETTVYLFHYGRADERRPGALLELYGRFFERLERYKEGTARLVRPTFGFIPGWSRLGPAPASDHPRVILVGDAAARHSPLTFCGFGATLRSLGPATRAILETVRGVRSEISSVVDDAEVHHGTGALSLLLASPPRAKGRENDLNALLDAAFGAAAAMPSDAFARLLRDELSGEELVTFLRSTARTRPRVYFDVLARLGLASTLRWGRSVFARA